MIGFPGPTELIIIFAIILLIFGANKLPEMARGLGKGVREFKKASDEVEQGVTDISAEPTDRQSEKKPEDKDEIEEKTEDKEEN